VLHEMIRREAPQLEPYIAPAMLADIGRSCVRIKRMSDVDAATLAELNQEGCRLQPSMSRNRVPHRGDGRPDAVRPSGAVTGQDVLGIQPLEPRK
jgi:hypothetical protein